MHSIAILISCYNRVEKTLKCLSNLYQAEIPNDYCIHVFLVDDGSTDKTSNQVRNNFPEVNIIQGSGSLYWNGGMRLAWKEASSEKDFNFYLWLNDDTILDINAINELLISYEEVLEKVGPSIIVGSCRISDDQKVFSYGGRDEKGIIIPNGELQRCEYINGNVVLISGDVFKKVGNLSSEFTHTMGDFDYGLRAIKAGINCFVSKTYIASCSPNEGTPIWCDPKTPLKKRWKHLHSTKGLNIKEYLVFRKKYWGKKWIIFAFKAYIKTIFPGIYEGLSKR